MKPSYILTMLLPLATQLAMANPTAEGDHHYDNDSKGNPCEVKYPYPYYKYPCNSAPENGTSLLGATFTSYCKYQNGEDSGTWFSTPRGWVKEDDKPRKCPGASSMCPV
jgi:hypothetical protein